MLRKIEGAKDLKLDEMKELKIDEVPILLINYQGNLYALSNKCTHLGCKLSKGKLEENIITCPCHGSKFDITNGRLVEWISRWPKLISSLTKALGFARSLSVYQIVEKDNDMYIDM
ncbi:MAG: Rieske (2Fe-2S) protein [Atribacterota bacterium]|nr:Rieske (2Fe-2S) protein [Atribacterota bacterium]